MKLGSPGFLGERLLEAREARGLTGTVLAELLGVSRQAVSQYEKGTASPAPAILEKLAAALNVPEAFFRRPLRRAPIERVFYRSFASATKTARTRAERRYGWLKEITAYLVDLVELPPSDFPDAGVDDPFRLKNEDIEQIAQDIREHYCLGVAPVSSMVVLLENHGGIVSRCPFDAETLDAFSEWSRLEGRPYFILNADKDSAVRSRLDAAHELGHMVLHRHLRPSAIAETSTFRMLEDQAFRFAGAFLLPAREFADDFFLPDLSELKRLKMKWGVAMAAVIKRCEDLDLLPSSEITRLWVAMGRNGWRKREPLDDETEPEQPRVLRDSFELLTEQRVRSRAELRDALHFSEKDIEDLANLPAGFFREPHPAPVVELKSRPAASRTETGEKGRVVPFPGRG